MEYREAKKYEYKSPSYELIDRSNEPKVDAEIYKHNARFIYDETTKKYRSKADKKDSISLLLTGDLLCQENLFNAYKTVDNDFDFTPCFDFVRPLLKSVDFVAGNLETSISHTAPYRGEILTHEGPYYCNAPIRYLEALAYAGFDMLTTANNQTLDTGVQGLFETIDNINKFGIIQTGTFKEKMPKYTIVDICGFKVGFTSFATAFNNMHKNLTEEGRDVLLNAYSFDEALKLYQLMKSNGAEYTICFPHWGDEYSPTINKKQKKIAKELASVGYDCIIGSHAHIIQQAISIDGIPIIYSGGNFISHLKDTKANPERAYTVLVHLVLTKEYGKIISKIEYIPCKILKNYKKIPYTVLPVNTHLGLTHEEEKNLVHTVSDVKKMLKKKNVIINRSLPIDETALKEYKDVILVMSEKTDKLIPAMPSKLKPLKKSLPIINETDDFVSYEKNRHAIYKMYADHAETQEFLFTGTGITISDFNKKCRVTVLNNCGGENNTTRIIYLPKRTEVIGESAFENYTALESVRFYKSLNEIKDYAFKNCSKLLGLNLPVAVTKIGDRVFEGCKNLLSVKIPPSVTEIGENAFEGCLKLTIYCEEGSFADIYAKDHRINVRYMPLSEQDVISEPNDEDEEVIITNVVNLLI